MSLRQKIDNAVKYSLVFLAGAATMGLPSILTQKDNAREIKSVVIEIPSGTTIYTKEQSPGNYISIGGKYLETSTMEAEHKVISNGNYKVRFIH